MNAHSNTFVLAYILTVGPLVSAYALYLWTMMRMRKRDRG